MRFFSSTSEGVSDGGMGKGEEAICVGDEIDSSEKGLEGWSQYPMAFREWK